MELISCPGTRQTLALEGVSRAMKVQTGGEVNWIDIDFMVSGGSGSGSGSGSGCQLSRCGGCRRGGGASKPSSPVPSAASTGCCRRLQGSRNVSRTDWPSNNPMLLSPFDVLGNGNMRFFNCTFEVGPLGGSC